MASGDESLESRLYDWLKRAYVTVDHGEYLPLDELTEELETTADQLRPVIERGMAQKRLAHKWRDKGRGPEIFSLTTERYLAAKAEAAERGAAELNDFYGFEPDTKTAAKPNTKNSGKPRKEKASRLTWRYAPVPLAIVDDRSLSAVAVRIAAIVARSINLGEWNDDLYAKLTYADLAERAGVSRATAARALDDLKTDGYIHVESLTRGGCRITFQQSHT
jgi:hypothetical protein